MTNIKIAYFSAEIGIKDKIKIYSGGLGILAGGTIKAMADLETPFCAVSLLYKKGYFKQKINENSWQEELEDYWDYKKILKDTKKEVKVNIKGEDVFIRIWKYEFKGITGHKTPIFLLDTNLEKNSDWAKELTEHLYVGDRLSQEIVLGIGGFRALEKLEINPEIYHMNEGHSAFLTLELYKKLGLEIGWDDGHVKDKCVFTTHTPIPAGHDKFKYNEVYEALKGEDKIIPLHIKKLAGENELNTTKLAMSFSSHINAVSEKHAEVTREMFPDFTIYGITNGVHAASWANKYLTKILDEKIKGWKEDSTKLNQVFKIKNELIWDSHIKAKSDMINFINKNNITGAKLKKDVLTIGFARRFIAYKDAELIFQNIDNLKKLGKKVQFVFAGKSHKNDILGKEIMKRIIDNAKELKDFISIAFIPDYDKDSAKFLVSGSDLWLNTPIPYNEASGTSGMKAAINGCLHFSRLDGWAIESFEMNGGGFPICDYNDLMSTLEYKIIPMFYSDDKTPWICEMKLSIGNSGSYFNTHRMAKEYIRNAYKLKNLKLK